MFVTSEFIRELSGIAPLTRLVRHVGGLIRGWRILGVGYGGSEVSALTDGVTTEAFSLARC